MKIKPFQKYFIREGTDAVVFGTYLYVGEVAFIIEFQGFLLYESKVRFYWNRRKFFVPIEISPKTAIFIVIPK